MADQPRQSTQDVTAPSGGVHLDAPSRATPNTHLADRPVEAPRLAGGKTPEMIAGYLDGVSFPQKKDALVRAARRNGAPEDVLGSMNLLNATEYGSLDELLRDYPRLPDEDEVAQHKGRP